MLNGVERGTILVVDDERLIRWSLRQRLERESYRVLEAEDASEAWQQFDSGVDLVLLDYRLPDADGMEILRKMVAGEPDVPVIMLTAHANVDRAVQAMKAGAYHYASKPFDLDEVALIVDRALENARLRLKVKLMDPAASSGFDCFIGGSPVVQQRKALLAKIASSPASTVLITGESGTGKDLAAKSIHHNSQRAEGPFLNITCSALAATLLESELFGHEKGAFTDAKNRKKGLLEHAHTGTVFLDEIGEMELAVQSKLLRFLEEKAFRRVGGTRDIRADVRIVAATNIDLAEAVRNRTFREDLYYRLAVLTVDMPPVRERPGDVELLVDHFVDRFNAEFRKQVERLDADALEALNSYAWPGNVRELRNVVERAVLLSEGPVLTRDDFQVGESVQQPSASSDFRLPADGIDFSELERSMVVQALKLARGNKTAAAGLLGMNRDQIRYRIEKFGLTAAESPTG